MFFLPPNKNQIGELLLKRNITPEDNYILAYSKMNTAGKLASWILLTAPASVVTNFFEKPYCLVFLKDEIVAIELFGKKSTILFKKNKIENFSITNGVNSSLIIEFEYNKEKKSFYSYKDASMRISYSAENITKLMNQSWKGYINR